MNGYACFCPSYVGESVLLSSKIKRLGENGYSRRKNSSDVYNFDSGRGWIGLRCVSGSSKVVFEDVVHSSTAIQMTEWNLVFSRGYRSLVLQILLQDGAKGGSDNGLRASSTPSPEAPLVCKWQRLEAGGQEGKSRGLGNRNYRGLGAEGITTKYEGCNAQCILCRSPSLPFLSLLLIVQRNWALTPRRLNPSRPYWYSPIAEPLRLPLTPSRLSFLAGSSQGKAKLEMNKSARFVGFWDAGKYAQSSLKRTKSNGTRGYSGIRALEMNINESTLIITKEITRRDLNLQIRGSRLIIRI